MMRALRPHLQAAIPASIVTALMLVWAVHNGGYDADTWYWGALTVLGVLAAVVFGGLMAPLSGLSRLALAAFASYVGWSYLSILWAESKGDALQGSNRALLYLLVFTLLLVLPWTTRAAWMTLTFFVLALGVVAVVLLGRLAAADHVQQLVVEGRLAAPTGYVNGTAALFNLEALTAIAISARRELPPLVRGMLLALAAASWQLALIVQSRGWLFTLPIVLFVYFLVVADRLRVLAASGICAAAVLLPLHRLLGVFRSPAGAALSHASQSAGRSALALCAGVFVVGVLLAALDGRIKARLTRRSRLLVGGLAAGAVLAAGMTGAIAATGGHPIREVVRQWRGFSHNETSFSTGSHFVDVGSGRYDYWRVSLDAFLAHPIGGLGQDNFIDYYLPRRRTNREPSWTHSLEMRLLAHTGAVGFVLFAIFLTCAFAGALRARRDAEHARGAIAGALLAPCLVWLIHGSLDWFWEIPALTGPALGFLAVAMALARSRRDSRARRVWAPRTRMLGLGLALSAVIGCASVLAFPYLAVREVSLGSNLGVSRPSEALADFTDAANLNPLSPVPGQLAGTVALRTGDARIALARFQQSITRDPGAWFAWLGAGLAASELGRDREARRDFRTAESINSAQKAVREALLRVSTRHPLTASEAFGLLTVVH